MIQELLYRSLFVGEAGGRRRALRCQRAARACIPFYQCSFVTLLEVSLLTKAEAVSGSIFPSIVAAIFGKSVF